MKTDVRASHIGVRSILDRLAGSPVPIRGAGNRYGQLGRSLYNAPLGFSMEIPVEGVAFSRFLVKGNLGVEPGWELGQTQ